MQSPGLKQFPEHTVRLTHPIKHLEVKINGQVVADTSHPLLVDEKGHDPVYYIPVEDVHMDELAKSASDYDCPFKGHAEYFSLNDGEPDIAWQYVKPYDEFTEMKNYIAFDAEKAEIN